MPQTATLVSHGESVKAYCRWKRRTLWKHWLYKLQQNTLRRCDCVKVQFLDDSKFSIKHFFHLIWSFQEGEWGGGVLSSFLVHKWEGRFFLDRNTPKLMSYFWLQFFLQTKKGFHLSPFLQAIALLFFLRNCKFRIFRGFLLCYLFSQDTQFILWFLCDFDWSGHYRIRGASAHPQSWSSECRIVV